MKRKRTPAGLKSRRNSSKKYEAAGWRPASGPNRNSILFVLVGNLVRSIDMARLTALLAVAVLVGSPSARAQEAPQEKRLDFKFRDASHDRVLEYVANQMGWTLAYSKDAKVVKVDGAVTAYNESLVPESKVVDFLNTALAKTKLQVFLYEIGRAHV